MFDAECPVAMADRITPLAPSAMSRHLLEREGIDALVAKDAPGSRVLTKHQLQESLSAMLARRPPGDLWVFGYGSLVWNPAMRTVERREAWIEGWHRSFCLAITALRATTEKPGLMLALDRGGTCKGIAYRIDEPDIEHELELLWRREMVCDFYIPRWVDIANEHGKSIGSAIAFTIDSRSPQYVADLDMHTIVQRLATAKGSLGSCRDYLFRTCMGLTESGCTDMALDHLASLVRTVSPDFSPVPGRTTASNGSLQILVEENISELALG